MERTEVVTNLANGSSVTAEYVFTDTDLRVTNNGDGTTTILILTTGNAVLYGEDGKAIATNSGQTRIEILIDALASSASSLRPGWSFEPKWDGSRAVISTEHDLRVLSRRGWDMTPALPEIRTTCGATLNERH